MVPLRLELKNFLSYGNEPVTIDFSDHKLVCLAGKNGHGKSAILEAISWAVWGQARKAGGASKPDEGLLRIGQSKMLVILDFKIDNHLYRVRREYYKSTGKASASLDFLVFDSAKNEFISLGDKTIKDTQKKIDSAIKIDFESFCNSTFLRQGNSNEFSKKSPRERKLLLAKILGLEKYDQASQKAADLAKDVASKIKILKIELQKNTEKCELEEKFNKELELELGHLDVSQKGLSILQEKKVLLDQKRLQIKSKADEIKTFIDAKSSAVSKLENVQNQYLELAKNWKENWKKILTTLSLQAAQANLDELAKKEVVLKSQLQHQGLLKDELVKINSEIMQRRHKLEQDFLQASSGLSASVLEHKAYFQSCQQQMAALTSSIDKMISEDLVLQKMLDDYQQKIKIMRVGQISVQQNKQLLERLDHFLSSLLIREQRLAMHKSLFCELESQCPLCFQLIDQSCLGKITVLQKQKKERIVFQQLKIEKISKKYKDLRQEVALKITEQEKMSLELVKLDAEFSKNIEQKNQLALKISDLKAQVVAAKNNEAQTLQKLNLLQNDLEALILKKNSVLAIDENLKELSSRADAINAELGKLIFLQKASQDLDLQLSLARKNLVNSQSSAALLQNQTFIKSHRKMMLAEMKKIKATINELSVKIGNTDFIKKEFSDLKTSFEETCSQILQQEKVLVLHRDASLKLKFELEQICKFKIENVKISEQIIKLADEQVEYDLIAEAFGKNGIQSMLIEELLPEIESATNQILDLISETQAKVFIEPIKDLKKGGVKESLDIIISDNSGIRDYEMFSGGEAFRIDFSLRIGISQVIAQRAGATLQTLIIDEGFGSLDEDGISLMMNCIYAIADRFEKIIVVSHLASMKDMFPVHFFVSKNSLGSKVSVEMRG